MPNPNNLSLSISLVPECELFRLNRFYKRNGHKGKVDTGDTAFWLQDEKEILAAVRFTADGDNLLLRGLWVHKERRGEGLGSMLLTGCRHYWEKHTCFCYPYNHLEAFYAKHGFAHPDEQAPEHLIRKLQSYQQRGEQVILMRHQLPCDCRM